MNNNAQANWMLNRQANAFKADLNLWEQRVRLARTPIDAARAASQRPSPGTFIRPLRGLYSSDANRANTVVEEALRSKLKDLQPEDPEFATIMRLTQGHWPKLYEELRQRRQAITLAAQDKNSETKMGPR